MMCWVRPERGDREMVVDGGGHFSPAGIDGVHTLILLFSSLTAHHRTEGNPHTHRNLFTTENLWTLLDFIDHRRWVQYMTETGEYELRSPVSNA